MCWKSSCMKPCFKGVLAMLKCSKNDFENLPKLSRIKKGPVLFGKRRRKCSKSAKNGTDNIRKSSQMANGVRVGHPAALLGRVFVPRVARLKGARRSQARLWPKIVHRWDLRAVIFRRKRENGWPRTHPKIRLWKRNEKDDKTVQKRCQNGGRSHGFGICVCGSLNLAKLLYL